MLSYQMKYWLTHLSQLTISLSSESYYLSYQMKYIYSASKVTYIWSFWPSSLQAK